MGSNKKKKINHKKFLSPSDAAKMLMISPITLRQWAQRGLLPAFTTLGGHRRFKLEDIEAFLNKNNTYKPRSKDDLLRILIIDDDENILHLLEHVFDDIPARKISVETATNGFDGGAKLYTFKPDFLLLDLKMKGMNGFDVCKHVKSNEATSNIRILTMTGFANRENTDRIIALGAEICFSKPLDIDALLAHIGLIEKDVIQANHS